MEQQPQVAEAEEFTAETVHEEPTYGYILTTRDGDQHIEDRDEAIRLAKEATLDNLQAASLEREDGRVKMQFRQGSLVDYVYETRKGRKLA